MRLAKLGPKNRLWKGGISTEYQNFLGSAKWKRTRKRIMERDGKTCQLCSAMAVAVDHKIPWRIAKDNSDDNLQAICKPCNTKKVHADRSIQ